MTVYTFARMAAWNLAQRMLLTNILRQSVQDLFSEAQRPISRGGNMPVDTGFLRNSLMSGLLGGTAISGPDSAVFTVATMKLGDVLQGGWTAEYARAVNYGHDGAAGRMFLEKAAVNWTRIVERNAARVR
jgi:hypothetical protein